MDIYFIFWVVQQYYLIELKLFCLWSFEAQKELKLNVSICVPLTYFLNVFVFILVLSYFLAQQEALQSYISCPCPRISHFPQGVDLVLLRRNRDMGQMCLLFLECHCFQTLHLTEQEHHIALQTAVYMHISINVSLCSHLDLF